MCNKDQLLFQITDSDMSLQISKTEDNCQTELDLDDEPASILVDSNIHQEGIEYEEMCFLVFLIFHAVFGKLGTRFHWRQTATCLRFEKNFNVILLRNTLNLPYFYNLYFQALFYCCRICYSFLYNATKSWLCHVQ